jgi:hypothetical protein
MVVEAWQAGRAAAEPERAALDAVAADLGELFASAVAPERRGLYLVSANAGFASSLAFWAGATRDGVAYASPALFPWTLSNAPCGWLAREFGVRGPNVTHTGRADALGAALHQCVRDLEDGQADAGWVVAIDFGRTADRHTRYAALRVSRGPGAMPLERSVSPGPASRLAASAALERALYAATRDGCGVVCDGHTAWTIRGPATSRPSRRARPTPPSRP